MFADVLDNEEERTKLVNQFLSILTKREEKILRQYYGIECKKEEINKLCKTFKIQKNSINRIKNNGVIKIIYRVTKFEPFLYFFSSDLDKDLMERCINERKSKLFDEFMLSLLKIKKEEWV
tara:strand:- start:791 stop:1153 length:363 start_codon:yes stop_codon:yes gene_type:complete